MPPKLFHIVLIGYGNMGRALHEGWRDGLGRSYTYTAISPKLSISSDAYTQFFPSPDTAEAQDALRTADLVLLAVKPQVMDAVCAAYRPFISQHAVVVSIAAGMTLKRLHSHFTEDQPVIRAMPNTPSAIGKGVTGYVANTACQPDHIAFTETLLRVSGDVHALDEEEMMDRLCAISGSGPAYVFAFTEALAEAGRQAGLSEPLALALARQTVIGASALMDEKSDTSPSHLREQVTSPGGTTQAALSHLRDGRIQEVMNEAIDAAVARGQSLSL